MGYFVRDGVDGSVRFLKAIDMSRAHTMGHDLMAAVRFLTDLYLFERDLCRQLFDSRPASRVVRPLDDGIEALVDGVIDANIPWIVFERGDGDIRDGSVRGLLTVAAVARSMHQASLGLWQLHQRGVAHQDVKPSNLLAFAGYGVKVADLGRAVVQRGPSPYDSLDIAGDPAYAPPEHAYGAPLEGWDGLRLACDMYQLGSIFVFLISGKALNALIKELLEEAFWPQCWNGGFSGSFEEALPYLRSAHAAAVCAAVAALDVGSDHREFIVGLIGELTDPDPRSRGAPRFRGVPQQRYSLQPFVSRFDALAWRLERGLRASVL